MVVGVIVEPQGHMPPITEVDYKRRPYDSRYAPILNSAADEVDHIIDSEDGTLQDRLQKHGVRRLRLTHPTSIKILGREHNVTLRSPRLPAFMCVDPFDAEFLLKLAADQSITKGRLAEAIDEQVVLALSALGSSHTEAWKRFRALYNDAFKAEIIDGYGPRMDEIAMEYVRRSIEENGKLEFDLEGAFHKYTVEVLMSLSFGFNQEVAAEAWEISDLLKLTQEKGLFGAFISIAPGVGNPLLAVYKFATGLGKIQADMAFLFDELDKISTNDSFLAQARVKYNEGKLDMSEFISSVLLLAVAGADTTARTFTSCIAYLSEHPELWNTLEYLNLNGTQSGETVLTHDYFKFVKGLIGRAYGTIQFLVRSVNVKNTVKSPTGRTFNKGIHLVFLSEAMRVKKYIMHKHPNLAKSLKFIDEFGAGQHKCPGENFAIRWLI